MLETRSTESAATDSTPPLSGSSRRCEECGSSLPISRILAVPTATHCVPCLTAAGDVPRVKRLDGFIGRDGEDVVSTYFTANKYLEAEVRRLMGLGSSWTQGPEDAEHLDN
jgi:hypothetical protein